MTRAFARTLAALTALVSLAGCGAIQNYEQGLTNNANNFRRAQALLDEQNTIEVNKLKALQRVQEIQAARAEGQKNQAQATGDAQAAIEKARGDAVANKLVAQSLSPLLVQDHLVSALNDKTMVYLPSGILPLVNVSSPGFEASQHK